MRRLVLCPWIVVLIFATSFLAVATRASAGNCDTTNGMTPTTVNQWERWQKPLTSTYDYAASNGNPYRTVILQVVYTECSTGQRIRSYGFWDQGKSYYIRGAFPAGTATASSTWQWVTTCSGSTTSESRNCSGDTGLNQKGRITVANTTTTATNRLYQYGLVRIQPASSVNNLPVNPYLVFYNSNRRFFWLGDTAWAASLNASSGSDWQSYVNQRATGGPSGANPAFTVIQMAPAPLWASSSVVSGIPADQAGRRPFQQLPTSTCTSSDNPPNSCSIWLSPYWTELETKVQVANQAGLEVVMVGLMNPVDENGGVVVPPLAEAQIFARNLVARLFGNHVIFSPGFDAKPSDFMTWISGVGNTIRDASCLMAPTPSTSMTCVNSWHALTDHPGGGSSLSDLTTLAGQSWLSFQMFQSGGCSSACTASSTPTAACQLSCAMDRAMSLPLNLPVRTPKINGESIYDGGFFLDSTTISDYRVRQTAYLSLLSGGTGYSVGECGITDWGRAIGCPTIAPLTAAANNSSQQMRYLRAAFQFVYWERLRPEPARIMNQSTDNTLKMAVSTDGVSTVIAYVPSTQTAINLDFRGVSSSVLAISGLTGATIPATWTARWVSPRTGKDYPCPFSLVTSGQNGRFHFATPGCRSGEGSCDATDWLLRITKNGTTAPPAVNMQSWLGVDSTTGDARILLQALDSSGNPTTAELPVSDSTWTGISIPTIATEPGGNSMVVWQSDNQDGDRGGIFARLYDSSGNPLAAAFQVNFYSAGDQTHPTVAAFDGGFVVAWASQDFENQAPNIRAAIYDRTGVEASEFMVNCAYQGDFPKVGTGVGPFGDTTIVFAWEALDGSGIYATTTDGAGNPTSSDYVVTSTTDPTAQLVLADIGLDSGGFLSTSSWLSYGVYPTSTASANQTTETSWTSSGLMCR